MRQASLQHVCRDILTRADGALGCALVDLDTGLPLTTEVRPGAPLNATSMELLSAMGVSYFDNGSIRDFDDDTPDLDDVHEIQTATEDAYYFMARVPGNLHELFILVTDPKTTNLGLGWMAMRQALARVQATNSDNPSNGGTPGSGRREPGPTDQSPDRVFVRRARNRRSIWD